MKCSKCGNECIPFRPMLEKQVGKVVYPKCENLKEFKPTISIKEVNIIQEKLIKFEKYIKRLRFNYPQAKKNMLWRFHEIFMVEMQGTETGDKFRRSLE